jgi:hypothetical protein
MEKLNQWFGSRMEAIVSHPWRSGTVAQQIAFWMLAAVPMWLLGAGYSVTNYLAASEWRKSDKAWQRGCFWLLLVVIVLGILCVLVLAWEIRTQT